MPKGREDIWKIEGCNKKAKISTLAAKLNTEKGNIMPITSNTIQNIIDRKGYAGIYSNPQVTLANNIYSLSIQTNGRCDRNVPVTNFVWITLRQTNGTVLYCEFKTGFSSQLNSALNEIADLLYFYQL